MRLEATLRLTQESMKWALIRELCGISTQRLTIPGLTPVSVPGPLRWKEEGEREVGRAVD